MIHFVLKTPCSNSDLLLTLYSINLKNGRFFLASQSKSTCHFQNENSKCLKVPYLILGAKKQETFLNCSPSRGQRKNIKFFRPAAKCCWPLFMQQGTTCVFLSASARPSYAGLFRCCNNGCSTQSFARVPVCW